MREPVTSTPIAADRCPLCLRQGYAQGRGCPDPHCELWDGTTTPDTHRDQCGDPTAPTNTETSPAHD